MEQMESLNDILEDISEVEFESLKNLNIKDVYETNLKILAKCNFEKLEVL